MVAGVIPDPLDGACGGTEELLESAILYVTRADWARVQDEFEALAGKFASLKVQLLSEGPLPWLARDISPQPMPSICCRANSPAPRTMARAGANGARRRCSRRRFSPPTSPPAALQIHQANHETARPRRADRADLLAGDARRDDAGSAAPNGIASRAYSPFGSRAGIFPAHPAGAERRRYRDAEDQHRYAQLSRASARHEGHCAEPCRALAAVAAGVQTGSDCGNPVLHAGRQPASRRICRCAPEGAKAHR